MSGIASIGAVGAGLKALDLQNQYQVKTVQLQKNALEMQGKMAVQLIQSAVGANGTGLDIQV